MLTNNGIQSIGFRNYKKHILLKKSLVQLTGAHLRIFFYVKKQIKYFDK